MQQFFLGVLLNMLSELILTWKLIILSILHVMAHIHKDKSVISSIPTSFEIRNRLLFVVNTINLFIILYIKDLIFVLMFY